MVRMKVDKEKCIGCALCETISENFILKDGKAEVIDSEESESNDMAAKDNCPTGAITVEEQNE